jgi:hypothetical protein
MAKTKTLTRKFDPSGGEWADTPGMRRLEKDFREWGVKSSSGPKDPDAYVLPAEEVSSILSAAAAISEKKRADYAGADPDENFTRAAKFAGLVCSGLPELDRRRATAMLIGVKLARLANIGLGGQANNESVNDTLTDLINYVAILQRQNLRAAREPSQ